MCKFRILIIIFSFGSWAGEKLFEVNHVSMIGDKFVVNLDKLECKCRKWTITGIPCCHSLTAMRFLNINIEQHIPHWFLTSTYEETYIPLIYPVNGPKVWEMNSDIDVLPPPKRILPGRPKKKRRLESWELRKDSTQLRQGGTRKRCGICRQIGHRRNGCPHAPKEPPTQPPTNPQTQPPTGTSQQSQPPTQGPETEQPIQQSQPPTQGPEIEQPIQQSQPTQGPGTEQPIQQSQPTQGPGTQDPFQSTAEPPNETPFLPQTEARAETQEPTQSTTEAPNETPIKPNNPIILNKYIIHFSESIKSFSS